jgi:hypothetical protein
METIAGIIALTIFAGMAALVWGLVIYFGFELWRAVWRGR